MHKRILQAVTVMMVVAMLITGCASEVSNIGLAKDGGYDSADTGFSAAAPGSYDSADTAVVMSIDKDNSSVSFMNMDTGKQYTLYYDGTTYIEDKYGGAMTISQLKAGDVVDVNFLKGKRQIARIQLSTKAWVYDNVQNYDFGGINSTATIGSTTYSLPENVVVFSEGERAEIMDVVERDIVTISGIDHQIYSVSVEKGHGYLRLKNEQALLGGWIEVGSSVIKEITEDMLLVVPEGSYQVLLSNDGISCTKDVVIERDKEVVLDVGDLEITGNKTGKIIFNVTPDSAEVTIDGKLTDISSAVELTYGIHQVHLEAEGYDSLTKYIQVGSERASISFTLEKSKEDTTDSLSQNSLDTDDDEEDDSSVSENTISATSSNKVYIDAPEDVEVYVDSNYVGIVPVSFTKVAGSHTITLRKSGYTTKSYTIYLYDDGEDITYSFSELEKEEDDDDDDDDSSVSDNDADDDDDDSSVSDNDVDDDDSSVSGNDVDDDDDDNSSSVSGNEVAGMTGRSVWADGTAVVIAVRGTPASATGIWMMAGNENDGQA
ncbi:MAG: PEGA domain-containing protein [Clostridiales bacterium]|nr:PEGA domain-containing protein [Clostridiales bacterium]